MPTFESADVLIAATGQPLGKTEWQVITQERIRAFADVTGDHQWIHLDERRARAEPRFWCSMSDRPAVCREIYGATGPSRPQSPARRRLGTQGSMSFS
jgi:hypothetical protein